jgi:hypothetical protein
VCTHEDQINLPSSELSGHDFGDIIERGLPGFGKTLEVGQNGTDVPLQR